MTAIYARHGNVQAEDFDSLNEAKIFLCSSSEQGESWPIAIVSSTGECYVIKTYVAGMDQETMNKIAEKEITRLELPFKEIVNIIEL